MGLFYPPHCKIEISPRVVWTQFISIREKAKRGDRRTKIDRDINDTKTKQKIEFQKWKSSIRHFSLSFIDNTQGHSVI